LYYDCQHHPVVGIDFGTTYSSVSKWDGKKAEIYGAMGEYTVPSAVYFKQGKFDVGNGALAKGVFHPENYILSIKRMIAHGQKTVFLDNKEFTTTDICSAILKYIYNNIKTTVPEGKFRCQGAVIAVPCYFKDKQCNIIEEAAKLADIELVGTIKEPVAAALAYGMHIPVNKKREENILVFDFGGGSLDITVLKIIETKDEIQFNILASEGYSNLGGLDFDEELYDYILKKEHLDFSNYDHKTANLCRRNLMEQIVRAKEILSYDSEVAYIKLYNIPPGNFLDTTLTLKELNRCIEHYILSIKNMLEYTIDLSKISKKDIHKIIKAGGSSKIKIIDNILEGTLGKIETYEYIDYKEVVSNGAAIYAAYKTNILTLNRKISISMDNMKKSLYFMWLVDCSGSMNIDNRLTYVKEGMKLVIPEIEEKCRLDNIIVNFGIIKFSDTAVWSVKIGEKINDSIYEDIKPEGITSLGSAIEMVSSGLNQLKINDKTLLPVIFLITDGMPTDHYDEAVEQLPGNFMAKNAYKDVIALGEDVCEEYMCKFIDDISRVPKRVLQKEHIIESICSRAINDVECVKDKFIKEYNKNIESPGKFPEKKIKGGLLLKASENK